MKNRQTIIPGRIIKCPAGYAAYVPNPLPPRIDWRPSLLHALSEADLLLGKLAGEGRRLPNPHMLIRPFVRREASLQPHRRNAATGVARFRAVIDRNRRSARGGQLRRCLEPRNQSPPQNCRCRIA